jgi:GNAT superfamily N-acetyltransferase
VSFTSTVDAVTDIEYVDAPPLTAELLARMLFVSYYDWMPPTRERPTFDEFVRNEPAVLRWTSGWGRPGDEAVLAHRRSDPLGLAWCRRLRDDDAGNSFVAEDIPCLAIAVHADARGVGIGTELLRRLIARLTDARCPALTLAVEVESPARRLYPRLGFVPDVELNGYGRMRIDLARSAPA